MNTPNTVLKYLSALLLLAIANCADAQYSKGMLTLSYSDSGGEVGKTTYIYNGMDKPYKAIWEMEDGSRWSENYHVFDSNSNMIAKYRLFSDSIQTRQFFTYDSSGKLIYETFSRSDGVEGYTKYHYNGEIPDYADCNGYNGWFYGTIRFACNDYGVVVGAVLLREVDTIGTINYHYNDSGRLVKERWEFSNGSYQLYNYTYRDTCKPFRSSNVFIKASCSWRINEEQYEYSGEAMGPSEYYYSPDGRLEKKIYRRNDGLETVTEFVYGEGGLLEQSVRQYSDGRIGIFKYNYNSTGHLIGRTLEVDNELLSEEEYEYSPGGVLLTGRYVRFDGWLTGKLTFFHNRYDNIMGAWFSGEDSPDALLSFIYDTNGNLEMVNWKFNNGTSQTYRFMYESTLSQH